MNDIYMITNGYSSTGSTVRRAVIVTPDYCFIVERYPIRDLLIWVEAISAKEGLELVKAFKSGKNIHYKKLLKMTMDAHQDEGGSERGTYTREEFSKLISDLGYGIDEYADDIYDAMWEMDYGMRVLNIEIQK